MNRQKLISLLSGSRQSNVFWYRLASADPVIVYQPMLAASQAASYANLVNPGTYDAFAGVAPSWTAPKGWMTNGITQYLRTGYTAPGSQNRTMAVMVSGFTGGFPLGSSLQLASDGYSIYLSAGTLYGFNRGQATKALSGTVNKTIIMSGNKVYLDGVDQGITIADKTITETENYLLCVKGGANPLFFMNSGSIFRAGAMWETTLSAAEALATSNAMNALIYGVVFEGDSLTDGLQPAPQTPYPNQCVDLLTAYPDWWNISTSGHTAAQIATQGAAADALYKSSYGKNVFVLWAGTNDILNGVSAADTFASIVSSCAGRKAAGFKTVVLTLHPMAHALLSPAEEVQRLALNSLINAGHASIDKVRDISILPNLQNPANMTFFQDGVHLTSAGYAEVAGPVADDIMSV
ncbi:MAG: hypothetical protein CVU44_11390 [Chloroflexi bacterium HGW-Chloroflexi-6]|nr:MAG: hypothetical protein CVU44_11390 [Chloroflexi bacterium HGW-Chloroflexi-6]